MIPWTFDEEVDRVPAAEPVDPPQALVEDLPVEGPDPKYFESQGDGAPCTNTNGDCESCRRVTDVIDLLRRRITAP